MKYNMSKAATKDGAKVVSTKPSTLRDFVESARGSTSSKQRAVAETKKTSPSKKSGSSFASILSSGTFEKGREPKGPLVKAHKAPSTPGKGFLQKQPPRVPSRPVKALADSPVKKNARENRPVVNMTVYKPPQKTGTINVTGRSKAAPITPAPAATTRDIVETPKQGTVVPTRERAVTTAAKQEGAGMNPLLVAGLVLVLGGLYAARRK